MKKIRVKYFVVGMLLILEIISLTLMYKSSHNKEVVLDEVKLKDLIKNDMISIMTDETGKGTYTEYTKSNTFPNKSYTYNSSKSQCINEKGSVVNNVLTFDGTKAILTSNEGMHCTLYFDKIIGPLGTLRENDDENQITDDLVGGMYRYQGTDDVNNYICFGTTKKDKCTSGTGEYGDGIDKYMYRIIGVTSDGELALIKESGAWWDASMGSYDWDASIYDKNVWEISDIYEDLNGLNEEATWNRFINSKNYDYLQNGSIWLERINDHTWKYGETKDYGNYNGDTMYAIENVFTNSVKAKIGLQYIHDYYYAYPGGNPGSLDNAKTSWIFFKNNINNGAHGSGDFFITMYGYPPDSSTYEALAVNSKGQMVNVTPNVYGTLARPVFYLKPDTVLKSGSTGSINDPYIIDGMESLGEFCDGQTNMGTCMTNKKSTIEKVKNLTPNEVGGMYRYQGTDGVNNWICFGVTYNCGRYEDSIDRYMYRIIGVTSNGELALIKETGIKENLASMVQTSFQWNNKYRVDESGCGSDGSKCTWPLSRIYNRLNGLCTSSNANCTGEGTGSTGQTNIFIGSNHYTYLKSGSTWLNKIDENHSWKYGDTSTFGIYNGDNAYSIESKFTTSIQAKIGLMYLYDYLYAYPGGNPGNASTAKTSWIDLSKDGISEISSEWLLSRYYYSGRDIIDCNIIKDGYNITDELNGGIYGVRPVFYLKPDVKISNAAGSKNDPFTISD